MSYIIHTSSGTLLTTIPTGKINTGSTSITLIGRDVTNYGRYYNQNLVNMLGNFANVTNKPPAKPLQGQLWYDTTYKKLKVYNGRYKVVGAAVVSELQPVGQEPGEFWYDIRNQALNFIDNNGQYNSITAFPRSDVSGWKFPLTPVYNNNFPGNIQQVTLLQSYGEVVGALTTASFIASDSDSLTTFGQAGTSSFSVAAGLTIIGDIKATGSITSKDISKIQTTNVYKSDGYSDVITTSTDLLIAPNEGIVFDLLPYSEVNYASPAIKIIDSQSDGYAGVGYTGTNITLNVGRIYHNFGALVIESDGSLFANNAPQQTLDGYGELILKNLDRSAGIAIGGPLDDYFSGGNLGTVSITAGTSSTWVFNTAGGLVLPSTPIISTINGSKVAFTSAVKTPDLLVDTARNKYDIATGGSLLFANNSPSNTFYDDPTVVPSASNSINPILSYVDQNDNIGYTDGLRFNTSFLEDHIGPQFQFSYGGANLGDAESFTVQARSITLGSINASWALGTDGILNLPSGIGDIYRDGVSVLGGGGVLSLNTASSSVLGGVKIGSGLAITADGTVSATVQTFNTSTLVAEAVYAQTFNTSTLVAEAVYAQTFNTSTLVAEAVSSQLATNAVTAQLATTATNAAYAYSFNTSTLVAQAVYAQTFNTSTLVAKAVNAQTVTGGVGVYTLTAGTGTAVSANSGTVTIWNTTPAVTGLQSRATVSTTTVSLTTGSSTTATVTMAKGYALYSIQANAGAWVTLYTSLATQASDVSRSITTDPTPGSGVIAEAITTTSGTTNFTPAVYGYNLDPFVSTDAYLKIYNNGASTTAITVTLTYLKLEI
jgi:hypothetical protein